MDFFCAAADTHAPQSVTLWAVFFDRLGSYSSGSRSCGVVVVDDIYRGYLLLGVGFGRR